MNVLLTGATGFLGQSLAFQIDSRFDFNLTSVVRRQTLSAHGKRVFVDQIDGGTDWRSALIDKDLIIHTAARVHVMKDDVPYSLREYRQINVNGTINLARQAAEAGVKRFIFISSIKVNGEHTRLGQPFRAENTPLPEGAYGISKWEAEQGLLKLASETAMEVVIIRPTLVYGLGVKGNFATLIKIVKKGIPLPLGAIHNKRSLISLDNLVDLIVTCITHPKAANQILLASDDHDLSTTELLRGIAGAAGVPSRLIPIPNSLLMFGAFILGRKVLAQRLLGSLQVDVSTTRDLLGWTPPLSVEEGLRRCFDENQKRY
jgi:nucleoside-diphosphate-sugar epimerase